MAPIKDHLSDHEYDGIREYDNPTPGWWHVIFLATVLFSGVYFVYWEFNPDAPNPVPAYQQRAAFEQRKLFGAMGKLAADEATMLKLMGDQKLMAVATSMFQTNCASCHARDGGGNNGVNLTDDSYKNIKALPDFFRVLTEGAGNGAMPSQRNAFSENERVLMAAYAASLRGTKPANPKPPEGEVIPAWPKVSASR